MLLKQGLDFLGGVETLIPKDAKILLKPNLLKKAEVEKAVITHPVVVGAFAGILRESGYENIVLADSCGHGTTQAVIRGTGMDTYLEKYHIPAVDYSEGVKTAYPQGVQAKEFILPKELLEQDCVISLSKMKTHALERITGAVKNSYGFVYGFHKAKGHTQYPSADSFARMLIDLNKCVAPKLYVMDGIVAMEGNGPASGTPVHMGVLLLSTDPVALDSVCCSLMNLEPELVPTNVQGEKMGLGVWREEAIEVITRDGPLTLSQVGERFGKPDYDVNRGKEVRRLWRQIRWISRHFQRKPYVVESRCIRCGICVEACPVEGKALHLIKPSAPVYDYKKCIACFCCQEMCPAKAIQVK